MTTPFHFAFEYKSLNTSKEATNKLSATQEAYSYVDSVILPHQRSIKDSRIRRSRMKLVLKGQYLDFQMHQEKCLNRLWCPLLVFRLHFYPPRLDMPYTVL